MVVECLPLGRHYKYLSGSWGFLIESLLFFMVAIIIFLLFLGFLFNNPMSVVFFLVACFLAIFLGSIIYSEGIVRSDSASVDIVKVDSSRITIDYNSSRDVSFTVGSDPLVSLLAPTFFYGGFVGLFITAFFVVKFMRSDGEEE